MSSSSSSTTTTTTTSAILPKEIQIIENRRPDWKELFDLLSMSSKAHEDVDDVDVVNADFGIQVDKSLFRNFQVELSSSSSPPPPPPPPSSSSSSSSSSDVAVLCCGPRSMMNEVQWHCQDKRFHFHIESYSISI
jgi:hypothetical protein